MKKSTSCPGNPLASPFSRREFLNVGLLGGLGLTLPEFLRIQAMGAQKHYETVEGKAKAVIQIFLPGGLAQHESFDPKPYAPPEYRGPFSSIKTSIPGIHFGEKLPHLAKIAHKITVINSMSHGEAAHERGTHNMFTGYRPSPAVEYPSMGSVISKEFGPKNNLPPYVCVPNVPNEYANSGYLSSAHGPFALGADPARGNFKVRDLNLPGGVDEARFNRRKSLLETVDHHFRTLENSDALESMDAFYQHAYKLISSEKAREAFNLEKEPDKLRDSYGRNQAGQRMILARRLVEAGVRFVSLTSGSWDHHDNLQKGIESNLPSVDQAVAALINDLEERGLLDSTLVILSTEFGRTPKINNTGGRDHWPRVFSTMMAGGGVKKGMVFGKSDALGGEPEEDKVSVEDFAKTIYHQLGINADKELMAPGERPIEIVDGGRVLKEILA
ncbi:Uncharacterized conserved protein, DUF1501 family [Rubritalea squalenifaciens DSM 18772]|uniref:Uncharacterized conserved protein, DUF1501 family n=2 Tax=Rubritalea TaxID=361050 RepID=A0A1M6PBR8_9BACT|nr:DUF1501 domain-containing protein [Rubritalea squalenifaciens]SHK05395.1 Uncharacterized conserved protein, DUF1501 family [Rubritalea squalenifaciens DSM 18772]